MKRFNYFILPLSNKIKACLYLSLFLINGLFSQTIENGSFEIHNQICGINVRNEFINNGFPGFYAFGNQSEIDVLKDSCRYGAATDGEFFIGLYNRDFSDAFSLRFSKPLDISQTYRLNFSTKLGQGISNQNSKVEIGLSYDRDQFGELLFTSDKVPSIWTEFSFEFQPDKAFTYLTVRISSTMETWVYLDHFYLECPNLNLGRDTILCKVEDLVLSVPDIYEEVIWKNGSKENSTSPESPGIFWVEVKSGECTLRDTLLIEEFPKNCTCEIYFPTAFSPDGNGINDTFGGFSNCEPQVFLLQIFDRWGNLVFESKNISKMWDGTFKNKKMTPDTFVYRAAFTFEYSSEWEVQSGFFNLYK